MNPTDSLRRQLAEAIARLQWPVVEIVLSTPKQKGHGDVATNAAFLLAQALRCPPREVAEQLSRAMAPLPAWLEKVEAAGAGFINFYLSPSAFFEALRDIFKQGRRYGINRIGRRRKVILEFVSANPTGPLNVVSARAAAVGDTLASLLASQGWRVDREYYVNDVGGQIDRFGASLAARYAQALGETVSMPAEGYLGEYLRIFSEQLAHQQRRKKIGTLRLTELGLKAMIAEQKRSLKRFGVVFDRWYRQSQLVRSKKFTQAIRHLQTKGHLYEQEGALFFRSTPFGDDKDRVVRKQDGSYSYFAADIAYHADKFRRGFDWAIDLFGPDHHGYVARTQAAVRALGYSPQALTILIIQQVNIVRGEKILKMSKRAGEMITMETLLEEVGRDVARYFFLQRSHSAPLDFDLELAKRQTLENPVFYIQYAHARICSIFRKAQEAGIRFRPRAVTAEHLDLPEEKDLSLQLLAFPDCLRRAAENLEVHPIAFYSLELAKQFQAYYSQAKHDPRYKVVDPNRPGRTNTKLYLLKNIQIVLQNALKLMGISAPERMESNAAGTL